MKDQDNSVSHLAEQVERRLVEEHPNFEIQTFEPNHFFDGYFVEVGYPSDPSVFPVWDEPGTVLYVESQKRNLPSEAQSNEGEEGNYQVLFIHADGFLASVDHTDGHFEKICSTENLSILLEMIRKNLP